MPWTTPSSATDPSWGASSGATTATYTASTSTAWGWEQLSSMTSSGGDTIAFTLRVDDQLPMHVLDNHPTYLLE